MPARKRPAAARAAAPAAAPPSRALVIKETWCEKIFGSTKIFELRGTATNKRGRICIAQSKTSLRVGEATLTNCLRVGRLEKGRLAPWSSPKTDKKNFLGAAENLEKHCVEDFDVLKYRQVYAWVLEDKVAYENPRPYEAKRGSVVWRKIDGSIQ